MEEGKNSCVITYEKAERKQWKVQQKQMDWIRERTISIKKAYKG